MRYLIEAILGGKTAASFRARMWAGSVLAFFLFSAVPAWCGQDLMKGPWYSGRHGREQAEGAHPTGNAGTALVSFYRRFVSPIDGSRCPMYPSCSTYAVTCFGKHGFLTGWMMTIDRLYRCGRDELALSPFVFVDGRPKCFDPVERNDFWWYHGTP